LIVIWNIPTYSIIGQTYRFGFGDQTPTVFFHELFLIVIWNIPTYSIIGQTYRFGFGDQTPTVFFTNHLGLL
nr:hypothetical protein [Microcoleaceae cyanobacterium MO_207.B10]